MISARVRVRIGSIIACIVAVGGDGGCGDTRVGIRFQAMLLPASTWSHFISISFH